MKAWLQVDGGVNTGSVRAAARAGADSLVAGSAVFRTRDPVAALRDLKRAAQKAFDHRSR